MAGQETGRNRIAIIAGRGSLPRELSAGLAAKGLNPFLIGIEGEHEDWVLDHDHEVLHWGQFGRLFQVLKEKGVGKILLAGGVTRPKINIARMDWGAIKTLPQILAFMIGGDNSLLTGVIAVFEKHGVSVVGAHEVMPELLTPRGALVGKKPSKKALGNITKAYEAAKRLGELDIGQAAVAVGGRVIAVEGIEGTDGMLARVRDLRASGRLTEEGTHGVLVKTVKPNQDMRVDLPAIGETTVRMAHEAGLAGVAVESDRSIILQRTETVEAGHELGIFVYGFETIPGAT